RQLGPGRRSRVDRKVLEQVPLLAVALRHVPERGEHLDTVEDAVGVVRGGDEHPFAYLWPAATLEWEQVGGEHAWGLRHPIALVAQGLDDDVPLVPVSWTGQVPDVLEDDKRRVVRLDDLEDVPVQGAPRILHAALGAGLGEGLAGEAGGKHVVRGDVNDAVVRVLGDVAER